MGFELSDSEKAQDWMSRREAIEWAKPNGIPIITEQFYRGCDGPFTRDCPLENHAGINGQWIVYRATDRARDIGHYEIRGQKGGLQ